MQACRQPCRLYCFSTGAQLVHLQVVLCYGRCWISRVLGRAGSIPRPAGCCIHCTQSVTQDAEPDLLSERAVEGASIAAHACACTGRVRPVCDARLHRGSMRFYARAQLNMPALLGMLVMGAVLQNANAIALPHDWSAKIRSGGLAVILLRAGLKIDEKAFQRAGCLVARRALGRRAGSQRAPWVVAGRGAASEQLRRPDHLPAAADMLAAGPCSPRCTPSAPPVACVRAQSARDQARRRGAGHARTGGRSECATRPAHAAAHAAAQENLQTTQRRYPWDRTQAPMDRTQATGATT